MPQERRGPVVCLLLKQTACRLRCSFRLGGEVFLPPQATFATACVSVLDQAVACPLIMRSCRGRTLFRLTNFRHRATEPAKLTNQALPQAFCHSPCLP